MFLGVSDRNGISVAAAPGQSGRRAAATGGGGQAARGHRGAPAPAAQGRGCARAAPEPTAAAALPAMRPQRRNVVRGQRHRKPLPELPPLLRRPRRRRHPTPRFQACPPPVLLLPPRSQGRHYLFPFLDVVVVVD